MSYLIKDASLNFSESDGWTVVGTFQDHPQAIPVTPQQLAEFGIEARQGQRVEALVNKGRIKNLSAVGGDLFERDQEQSRAAAPVSRPPAWRLSPQDREVLRKKVGQEFHNPYTFIPFAAQASRRSPVTPRTADERTGADRDRTSGILELKVTTRTPLRTVNPEKIDCPDNPNHAVYAAQTIGPDVVVPATGIRGALRNLMTILIGAPLTAMDDEAILCQGRDLLLGSVRHRVDLEDLQRNPDGEFARAVKDLPLLHLGEVVVRRGRPRALRIGETRLVSARQCGHPPGGGGRSRERDAAPLWLELQDLVGQVAAVTAVHARKTPSAAWKLKLSGRPIRQSGDKFEGALNLDGAREVAIPDALWRDFEERHRHGVTKGQLKDGDLVWLEAKSGVTGLITDASQIESIQWARWGRKGAGMRQLLPEHVWPDSVRDDSLVSEVTNLFGHLAAGGSFAGRIRPENLVFRDAAEARLMRSVSLAPLSAPRPGCIAFYRSGSPKDINRDSLLKGYKVYRTEQGNAGPQKKPWLFTTQGVFDRNGLKSPHDDTNQTCDLLVSDTEGSLRIAFRGLTDRELALLLLACGQPWRLGGGKPLGLGLCRVEVERILDETGAEIDAGRFSVADDAQLSARADLWRRSQEPVPRLRYPRMRMGPQAGGHVWFGYFAQPHMTESGLQPRTLFRGGPRIDGQMLPDLAEAPDDVLYGYDRTRVGANLNEE